MSDESNIVHAHLMINGQRHPNGTSGSIVSPTSYNKHSTSSISDTSDASCRGTIDNRTSMHRCLQITEILTLILDCYDDYAPDKNTLLQLALVCKAFHEPALDALWKFQQSFMILVMTFPRDLWEVTVVPYIPAVLDPVDLLGEIAEPNTQWPITQKHTILTFKRPLTPLDWPRFKFYARRMNHLSFTHWSPHWVFGARELSANVLSAINSSLDQGHCHRSLFQNLKRLTCDAFGIPLREICIFLSPRLTSFWLSTPDSPFGLETFFTAVQAASPFLKVVSIDCGRNSEKVRTAVSSLICGLPCLEVVSCSTIALNYKALVALASLPKLWRLHVVLPGGPPAMDNCRPLPFSSLQDFKARAATIADADEFLRLVSGSTSLYSLSVEVLATTAPRELHSFLTTVHRSSSRDTLTKISLHDISQVALDAPVSHSLDVHTILPLLQCPNLQDILFGMRYGQDAIDNSLMMDMAMAWPHLRSIHFSSFHRAGRWHSKVNLDGLVHLAQGCRALERMSLGFDLSLPVISTHPGVRNESLTYLCVDRSPITDPLAVATFLSDVFPKLELRHGWRSSGWGDDNPEVIEMCKRWEEVNRLLEIGKQERSQAPKQR